MTKILMVCLGNICRSPLAEGILQSKLSRDFFIIDSAGTGDWHIGHSPDKRSIQVAKKNGIDISQQKGRQITQNDLNDFDYIYVMDHSNLENVLNLCTSEEQKDKVKLILSENPNSKLKIVPDPYFGAISDFEDVFQILDQITDTIAQKLK